MLQSCCPRGEGSAFALYVGGELVDLAESVPVAVDELGDLGRGVHHRGVVPAAEGFADLRQRFVGELAGEVHGYLAWVGEALRAALADEVRFRDAEVPADLVLDQLYGDLAVSLVRQYVL